MRGALARGRLVAHLGCALRRGARASRRADDALRPRAAASRASQRVDDPTLAAKPAWRLASARAWALSTAGGGRVAVTRPAGARLALAPADAAPLFCRARRRASPRARLLLLYRRPTLLLAVWHRCTRPSTARHRRRGRGGRRGVPDVAGAAGRPSGRGVEALAVAVEHREARAGRPTSVPARAGAAERVRVAPHARLSTPPSARRDPRPAPRPRTTARCSSAA